MARLVAAALLGALLAPIPHDVFAQAASAPPAAARTASAAEAVPTAADPVLEARMLTITEELRCLVCQNQTIAESHADLASDLRDQVRQMLRAGRSPDEIRRYMTDRYGDFILYKPPWKASTLFLWLGPALLLVIGSTVLIVSIRRRARLPDDRFEPDPVADDLPEAAIDERPRPPASIA
jgi:cytochrome c-type biogenesis protein CcmH